MQTGTRHHPSPATPPLAGAGRTIFNARRGLWAALLLALLGGLAGLESAPPLWWDEGWTLCVARSLAELGHYGCLINGERGPSTLSAHLPVVAPIALSFALFDVGIWQARLVGLLLTLGALLLLARLTARLYSQAIALAALLVLLALPTHWQLHPLYIGRQVLGEPTALFALLAGYSAFLAALRRPWAWMLPACLCWAVAIMAKLQILPFWGASLIGPLLLALLGRQWRAGGLLALGLAGGYGLAQLLDAGADMLLAGRRLPGAPISGLNETLSLVLIGSVRLDALAFLLSFGLPTALGLAYGAWRELRPLAAGLRAGAAPLTPEATLRLVLLSLVGSWVAWFGLLSVGWPRYFFPAMIGGAPFVGVLLHDLSGGFALRQLGADLREAARRRWGPPAIRGLALMLLIGAMALLAGRSALLYARSDRDRSVVDAAALINSRLPPGALVETYESELFFLLDRPYHYPPPQVHVALIQQQFTDPNAPVDYDPLAARADYLVVGPFSSWTGLYNAVLAAGDYVEYATVGHYHIYRRAAR